MKTLQPARCALMLLCGLMLALGSIGAHAQGTGDGDDAPGNSDDKNKNRTPGELRDIRVEEGDDPVTETFVFCTPCHKITVTITLSHGRSPAKMNFKAEKREDAKKDERCKCEQEGWVQFVREGPGWEFDNAMTPRFRKRVGETVPPNTPAKTTQTFEDLDGTEYEQEVMHDPWYGEDPTNPQSEIEDQPGTSQERIVGGENDGAFIKQFVTRFVWRNKNADGEWEDGIHDFELRWRILWNPDGGWSKIELEGTQPTSLPSADANCNATDKKEKGNNGGGGGNGGGDSGGDIR